ncbi:hypothetical protein SAMN05444365_10437 [Micromonospora pattaloongensis]|uniref:Integral membrane protein n=1 Tax=Micromonospora pattaloongensis TaxID=405436 RepID=A0A1H3NKT4_9ACTN|nr:DUF6114 domain-containing protein [Micromonospora pattaloongensis]SDY89414.1 hypothetical protein SAMN05444365_10437 [Micromonospora pattaloongensis]
MAVDREGTAAPVPAPRTPADTDYTAAPRAAAEPPRPGRRRAARLAWRRWRRTRPFWGGLFVILGAAEILASVRAPLPVVLHVGPQGLAGYLVPLVLLLCGLLLLFNPQQRTFYSLVAVVLALTTWLTSNLGGFFIGLLLAVLGASLAFAWTDGPQRSRTGLRRRVDA